VLPPLALPADAGAGKSADRAPDDPAWAELYAPELQLVRWEQRAAVPALCKQGEAQFAERSCEARVAAEVLRRQEAQRDAAEQEVFAAQRKQ